MAQENLRQTRDAGAAATVWAFDGTKIVLQPIVDAAHLVHAPLACEGNGWDNRGAASSGLEFAERIAMLYQTRQLLTDLIQMELHGLGICVWHHQASRFAQYWADCAKQISILITLIGGQARPCSLGGPDAGPPVLLSQSSIRRENLGPIHVFSFRLIPETRSQWACFSANDLCGF